MFVPQLLSKGKQRREVGLCILIRLWMMPIGKMG